MWCVISVQLTNLNTMKTIVLVASLFISVCVSAQEEQPIQEVKGSIYFDLDKAVINDSSRRYFQQEILNKVGYEEILSVSLQGHTDGYAGNLYNQLLSERRVDSVKKLFPANVYRDELFLLEGFGKSKPNNTNDTEDGRRKNRRVDIVIEFRHILTIGEIDMVVEPPVENDTIIYGEKGTELHIKGGSFHPYRIKDVDFSIKEVYSLADMIRCGTVTTTSDGNCLESGGMVFSSSTVAGETVTSNEDMLVRIPASEIDTAMKIYSVEVVDGDTLWKETSMALNFNEEEGFYEFNSRSMPNFNIDKVPVAASLAAPIIKLIDMLKDDDVTVKSRRYKYAKSFLVGGERKVVLKGRVFKPKKSYFQPCDPQPSDVVVSYAERKGETYFYAEALGKLKYRSFFRRYIIKKKNYVKMSEKEIDEKLDVIFANI